MCQGCGIAYSDFSLSFCRVSRIFQKPPGSHTRPARRHKLQTQFFGFSSWITWR